MSYLLQNNYAGWVGLGFWVVGWGRAMLAKRGHPYHSTAIETGEHLLRCLVYVDLNMVREGVVKHPSEWPHGGYNEIQAPRRKNAIIAHDRLCGLAGFKNNDAFRSAHQNWVQSKIGQVNRRDEHCAKSIAIGSSAFIRQIQSMMGAMAAGRKACEIEDGHFILRAHQASNNAVFRPQNSEIGPKKAASAVSFQNNTVG